MSKDQIVLFSGCGFDRLPVRVVDVEETYVLVEVDGVGYYAASPEELEPAG